MPKDTPPAPHSGEPPIGPDSGKYLDEFVEWDMVPSWNVGKQRIRVWLDKVTVRDLLERGPEVGSEEAVAATTEGLRRLVARWENAEEGCWLLSVPPLLRVLGYTDFSPRYAELLEAMRLLGLSVRLHVYGWVGAEELRRQHMWDARTHEIMNRQRRATRLNQDKEFVLRGIKIRLGSWGPAKNPRPKFDRRNPRRDYKWATVEEWSRFPGSREDLLRYERTSGQASGQED